MTYPVERPAELPRYWAEPENPQAYARHWGTGGLQLLRDVRHPENGYHDGMHPAQAELRNGYTHGEVGDMWLKIRPGLQPDEIGPAARRHCDKHLIVNTVGALVIRAAEGESNIDYTRRILSDYLRRPARP